MKWFDRIAGVLGIALGTAMLLPGAFLLLQILGIFQSGLDGWVRWTIPLLSAFAILQIIGGANIIRWAGQWE